MPAPPIAAGDTTYDAALAEHPLGEPAVLALRALHDEALLLHGPEVVADLLARQADPCGAGRASPPRQRDR